LKINNFLSIFNNNFYEHPSPISLRPTKNPLIIITTLPIKILDPTKAPTIPKKIKLIT